MHIHFYQFPVTQEELSCNYTKHDDKQVNVNHHNNYILYITELISNHLKPFIHYIWYFIEETGLK